MQPHTIKKWQHSHDFSSINEHGERRTTYVLILTAVTMVVEIVAGTRFGSMALLADGWHMGTHVAAFAITLFAYRYARAHSGNPLFSFGTGKVSVLGGFASAIALAVVALVMLIESVQRIFDPLEIQFNEAIAIAVIGLLINLVSALLLMDHHHHDLDHSGSHHHHHHDHNLRAAYFHVLADALTSMLAIVALVSGKYLGWNWLDPMMGIVGAVIITRWSYGLMKQSAPILLDAGVDEAYLNEIREAIEQESDSRIVDMHVWPISARHQAAIISLLTPNPEPINYYKGVLKKFDGLSHVTVEVNKYDS